jgi:predicted CopG family antitoxin
MTKGNQASKLVMVKKVRRSKQIRITDKTYEELAKLGDVTDDFEDVVARILKFYKEHHTEK